MDSALLREETRENSPELKSIYDGALFLANEFVRIPGPSWIARFGQFHVTCTEGAGESTETRHANSSSE
jgi:hypothetical protein